MIKIKWSRWIKSSIVQHFRTNITGVDLYIEGMERPNEAPVDLVEVRMDGPEFKELSHEYFRVYVEINLLLQVTINDEDIYHEEDIIGEVCNAFTKNITIRKKGQDSEDDDSVIGCLDLMTRGDDGVKVNRFGQIEPNTRLLQSTIEGHYEMFLEGE